MKTRYGSWSKHGTGEYKSQNEKAIAYTSYHDYISILTLFIARIFDLSTIINIEPLQLQNK